MTMIINNNNRGMSHLCPIMPRRLHGGGLVLVVVVVAPTDRINRHCRRGVLDGECQSRSVQHHPNPAVAADREDRPTTEDEGRQRHALAVYPNPWLRTTIYDVHVPVHIPRNVGWASGVHWTSRDRPLLRTIRRCVGVRGR